MKTVNGSPGPTFEEKRDSLWDYWRDDTEKREDLRKINKTSTKTAEFLISCLYGEEKDNIKKRNSERKEKEKESAWRNELKKTPSQSYGYLHHEFSSLLSGAHPVIGGYSGGYLASVGVRTDMGGMGDNGFSIRVHPSALQIIVDGLKLLKEKVVSEVEVTFEVFPGEEQVPSEDETEEKEEEEDDELTPFTFEGVKYIRTEDGEILTPDYDMIGEDDGGGGIDWLNEEAEENHRQLVADLEKKEEDEDHEAEPYEYGGKTYMKIWDEDDEIWIITDPETGETVGFPCKDGTIHHLR